MKILFAVTMSLAVDESGPQGENCILRSILLTPVWLPPKDISKLQFDCAKCLDAYSGITAFWPGFVADRSHLCSSVRRKTLAEGVSH